MSEENKPIDSLFMTEEERASLKVNIKEELAKTVVERMQAREKQLQKESEAALKETSNALQKAPPAADTVAIIQMPRAREIKRNERFNLFTALALMDQPNAPTFSGRLAVRKDTWVSWEYMYLTQLPYGKPGTKTLVKTTAEHRGSSFPTVQPYAPNPDEFTDAIWSIAEHCECYPVRADTDYSSQSNGYPSITLRQYNPHGFDTSTGRISNANQEMEQRLLAGEGFRRDDWPENEYVFFWIVNGETVPIKAVVENERTIELTIYPMRGIKNRAVHFIPSKYKRIDLTSFGEHEQSVMLQRLKEGHKGTVNFIGTDKVKSLSL